MRRILLAFALAAGLSARAGAADLQIVIYHTNDVHGWVMARPATFSKRPDDLVGGFAALSNVVKSDPRPKLLLDAGDWFQGTPEGNLSKGRSLVDAFNALGYDAVEVGNHDFDFGEANLQRLVTLFKMPVLGANVYSEKTGRRVPYLAPRVVKTVDGVKIGIFGLLTTAMRGLEFPENIRGLRFRGEVEQAKRQVRALRKEGATVIIAVTHVGYESPRMGPFVGDQTIAREVPGIDVIVGGHTHTFVRDPQHDPKHGTLIVQAGSYLSDVGQVVLDIDPASKKVKRSSGRLITLWVDEHGQDPRILALLKPYEDEVRRRFDVAIATATSDLKRESDAESPLGDWMTDCARAQSGADIAVQNAGGIRADMTAGPVTLRAIYDIMPFDNYAANLTMDGKLVREMLDHGVDRDKGMIQVSGVTLRYDRGAPRGHRVRDVLIGGKPLDARASYRVSTIDFLVRGGDGYSAFARSEKKDFTRLLWRDMLADCARREATIEPPASGRMTPETTAMEAVHGP